jgi:hypothetical protein
MSSDLGRLEIRDYEHAQQLAAEYARWVREGHHAGLGGIGQVLDYFASPMSPFTSTAQAPPALEPASLSEEELFTLGACIKGIAVEEMEAWKRHGFAYAYAFAKRIAERAIETWTEPEPAAPQDTREAPASTEEAT